MNNISLKAKMLLDMKRGNVSISVPVKHFCGNKGFSCNFDILRVRERVNSTCGSGSAFASREREITTPSDFSKKINKKIKDSKDRKAKQRLVIDSKVVKRHCRGSKA